MGTISTETCWAWATFPGSIWRTVAIHSPKTWVRQTAICKRFGWQEWMQEMETDLNIPGHDIDAECVSKRFIFNLLWLEYQWKSLTCRDMLTYQIAEHILSCCMKPCINFWFPFAQLFALIQYKQTICNIANIILLSCTWCYLESAKCLVLMYAS